MGFPVQDKAPKVTVQGRTLCVSAFEYNNVLGQFYTVGIYEQQLDGSWNRTISFVEQDSGILELIQNKGGKVKFLNWLVQSINAFFLDLFGNKPSPSGEPLSETEARNMIANSVLTFSFSIVDGVPIISQALPF